MSTFIQYRGRCSMHGEWINLSEYACPMCKHIEAEAPPVNTQQNNTGVKHDQGKPATELLSPIALIEISKVMEYGSRKYAAHNWRKGIAWSRLLGAALRHLLAFLGGQDKDPETGLSHLSHLGCCVMFLLEYEVTHKELDDRYKGEGK